MQLSAKRVSIDVTVQEGPRVFYSFIIKIHPDTIFWKSTPNAVHYQKKKKASTERNDVIKPRISDFGIP